MVVTKNKKAISVKVVVNEMSLTEKQRRFADEYIQIGKAYPAAINAGYSPKYAKTNSHKMLENTRIKAYIDNRLDALKKDSIADQDEILQFLTSIMRGEVREPLPILSGDGHQEIVNVTPNAQSRKNAAELLGKRYRMWTDKMEVEGALPVVIYDDLEEDDPD